MRDLRTAGLDELARAAHSWVSRGDRDALEDELLRRLAEAETEQHRLADVAHQHYHECLRLIEERDRYRAALERIAAHHGFDNWVHCKCVDGVAEIARAALEQP